MSSRLIEIFEDAKLVNKIKNKLPYLFQLAESEVQGQVKPEWKSVQLEKG